MRRRHGILTLLVLSGCPWIGGPPPGDVEPDTTVEDECVDVDFDGVCDDADACVDGVDDTTDTYVLQDGQSVSGLACGDEDSVRVPVDAGCTYNVSVDGPDSLNVEVIEDSDLLASGPAPLSYQGISASFVEWELLLFGADDAYTASVTSVCPSCGTERVTARWGEVVTARLCPWSPELTVVVDTIRPECDYGVLLVTSDQTTTTLVLSDGVDIGELSGDSGYLSVVGPVSPNAWKYQVVISQPSDAPVEQGVLLELTEYCE